MPVTARVLGLADIDGGGADGSGIELRDEMELARLGFSEPIAPRGRLGGEGATGEPDEGLCEADPGPIPALIIELGSSGKSSRRRDLRSRERVSACAHSDARIGLDSLARWAGQRQK